MHTRIHKLILIAQWTFMSIVIGGKNKNILMSHVCPPMDFTNGHIRKLQQFPHRTFMAKVCKWNLLEGTPTKVHGRLHMDIVVGIICCSLDSKTQGLAALGVPCWNPFGACWDRECYSRVLVGLARLMMPRQRPHMLHPYERHNGVHPLWPFMFHAL